MMGLGLRGKFVLSLLATTFLWIVVLAFAWNSSSRALDDVLRQGVAEKLEAAAGSGKSIADFRREALAFGVRLFACPTALASHGVPDSALISTLTGQAGAAAFLGRSLDPAWRTLSF